MFLETKKRGQRLSFCDPLGVEYPMTLARAIVQTKKTRSLKASFHFKSLFS
jgi:hypothetical protein